MRGREHATMKTGTLKTLLAALMLGAPALSQAAELSEPLILVAKPELRAGAYASTVLVVKPVGGDRHVGFIVNRPTGVTVREIFPEHGPSQKIVEPVYVGGPLDMDAIFALVQRRDSPGAGSFEVLPGLYAAFAAPTVDRIIESDAERARFVAGLTAWRPGELDYEIRQGAWYVLEPDAALALRKPEGLWEELVQRSAIRDNAI
jgi:putative transcriptional regulator